MSVAVLLLLMAMPSIPAAFAGDDNPGGQHTPEKVCPSGIGVKFEGREISPDSSLTIPGTTVVVTITSVVLHEGNEVSTVSWIATDTIEAVYVKASDDPYEVYPGGMSGTLDRTAPPAISHIIFCLGEPEIEYGSLSVTKSVLPDGDYGVMEFSFEGSCDLTSVGGPVVNEWFDLGDGDTWTFGEPIPEYWDGAPCWLKETQTHGATVEYWNGGTQLLPDADGKVHFALDVADGNDMVIDVENTFTPDEPRVTVVKDVAPNGAAGTAEFDFVYQCRGTGEGWSTDGLFSLTENGSHDLALPPNDATCTIVEYGTQDADDVTFQIGAQSITLAGEETLTFSGDEPPVEYTGPAGQFTFEGEDLTVVVLNEFEIPPPPPPPNIREPGDLTIQKLVVDPGGLHDGAEFDITLTCGATERDVDPFVAGEIETIADLAAGTVCSVDEPDTEGATATATIAVGGADATTYTLGEDFTIGEDTTVSIVVTNTYPEPGTVTVTKSVVDPSDQWDTEDFHFVLSVGQGEGEEFFLTDAETATFTVPVDAEISLVEDDSREAPDVTMTVATDGGDPVLYTAGTAIPVTEGIEFAFEVVNSWPAVEPAVVELVDIDLEKVATPTNITYDGDGPNSELVTYTYVITNTGEAALTALTLVDDQLGTIAIPAGELPLAAGESIMVTTTYTVTADDVGSLVNVAIVEGTAADGRSATATDDAVVTIVEVKGAVLVATGVNVLPLLTWALLSLLSGAVLVRRTR